VLFFLFKRVLKKYEIFFNVENENIPMYFPKSFREYLIIQVIGTRGRASISQIIRTLETNKEISSRVIPSHQSLHYVVRKLIKKGIIIDSVSKQKALFQENMLTLSDEGVKLFQNLSGLDLYVRTCERMGSMRSQSLLPNWHELKTMCKNANCSERKIDSCFHLHKYSIRSILRDAPELRRKLMYPGTRILSNLFDTPMECQEFIYWLRTSIEAEKYIESEKFKEYYKQLKNESNSQTSK
jgi:DNA-binding PadR family transcriptional regulator